MTLACSSWADVAWAPLRPAPEPVRRKRAGLRDLALVALLAKNITETCHVPAQRGALCGGRTLGAPGRAGRAAVPVCGDAV